MGLVSVGVPQGSILGPLLFSIYVNDLPTVVRHSQLNMFADDTELHLSGHDLSSVQQDFQCDLDAIQAWLCVNRLQLNVSKSVVMLIGTRQRMNHRNVSVHISGQVLTQVPYTKYLGAFIDQHLTWQKHTEFVLQRVRGKVHCLHRLRPLSDSLLFRLCRGFVLPIFVIPCGLLRLHCFRNLWSVYMPDLLVTDVMIKCWFCKGYFGRTPSLSYNCSSV